MIRTPAEWRAVVARHREIARVSSLDGACQITHGRYFWPLEPWHPGNDFDIEFIAMVLAGERRWGGIITDANGFPLDYSVAQHCVHVADVVNLNRAKIAPTLDWSVLPSPALYGLMHDASEAYLKDFPRPVKGALGDYYGVERALMDRLMVEFAVPCPTGVKEAVKVVDDMFIWLERDKLVGQPVVPYSNEFQHCGFSIDAVVPDFHVWDRKTAMTRFLEKYEEIVKFDGNKVPQNYLGRGYTL